MVVRPKRDRSVEAIVEVSLDAPNRDTLMHAWVSLCKAEAICDLALPGVGIPSKLELVGTARPLAARLSWTSQALQALKGRRAASA